MLKKNLLSVLSITFLCACGAEDPPSSSLRSTADGRYWAINASRCLDQENISIIDNFQNPPRSIVITVPASKDCSLLLSGTETLKIINLFNKKPWDKTNSFNIRIEHSTIGKCLTFGEGGGIRNVSWQKCRDWGQGTVVQQNSQMWTMRNVGTNSFQLLNYTEFVNGSANPKERCLNLGAAPKYQPTLGSCGGAASAWKF